MLDFPTPSIEDIVLGFQVQATCDLPGKNLNHRVTMGVLWASEVADVSVATGRQVAANDLTTRILLIHRETLVQAITQVDEWVCHDPDNPTRNLELKAELRKILSKCSMSSFEYLWQFYDSLCQHQSMLFKERVEELKKSSRPPDAPESIGIPPYTSDTHSGEVGGEF
jgi:hypothetical protein